MLSVVVPTNRLGLDTLFAGLRGQTFTDFELLLVDELFSFRGGQYHGELEQDLYHIGFDPRGPRWGRYMASLNKGLERARGDRLLFLSDYTVCHPETIATHAKFHSEFPNDVCLGGIEYCDTPPIHPDFPLRYGWAAIGHDVANHREDTYAPWLDDKRRHELCEEWRIAYETDLDSGKLDRFMYSTFAEPIRTFNQTECLRVFNRDMRDTSPFLNLKNDSIPRSLLEKIGGFDERADGTHGHQDSVTWKHLAKAGAKLQVLAENPVKILDAHSLMIIRRNERPDDSNLGLYNSL